MARFFIPSFLLAIVAGIESLSLVKNTDSMIEVSIDCGASVSENSPVLKILTDVDITAVAKCKNGDQSFTSSDSVHYILPATLTSSAELCQLNEKKGSDNYDITVEVHYGEADSLILTKSKRVTVVCTYSDYGQDDSPQHSISNGPQAHIEKQTLVGTLVPSSELTLSIQTVDNQDAVGAIAFDRRYSLFGSYTGTVTNVGLKPVSCYAVSDDGQESYAVLTSGCGDGFIFDRTDGFITTGKTFRSPYFFAFNLANSGNLAFNCKVTLCSDCDGTSCETDCGSERYAITNGQLDGCKGNNKYEDTCKYVCDTGYDKEGDGISTCGADGIWTVPPIVCTPCDVIPSGSTILASKDYIMHSSTDTTDVCDSSCTGECTASVYHPISEICLHFSHPVLKAIVQTDAKDFSSCVEACRIYPQCKTTSNLAVGSFSNFICLFFDQPSSTYDIEASHTSVHIADKVCKDEIKN